MPIRRLFAALEKVAGNVGLIREAGKEMRTFTHAEGTLVRQLGESRQRMEDLQLMRAEQTRQMHTTVARQVLEAIHLVERRQHALLARQSALVHLCRELMQERDALAAAAGLSESSGNGSRGSGGGGNTSSNGGGSGNCCDSSSGGGSSGNGCNTSSGGSGSGNNWGSGMGPEPGWEEGQQEPQGAAWPSTAEQEQQQGNWWGGSGAKQAAQQEQSSRPADTTAGDRLRGGGGSSSGSGGGNG